MALAYRYFPTIYIFLNERIFGIKLKKNQAKAGNNNKSQPKDRIDRFIIIIGERTVKGRLKCGNNCCLTFVASITLTVAFMALFEGCILANAGLYPGDPCPDDPVTCFVSYTTTSGEPASSFDCTPGNISAIPPNANGVWCYGWIVRRNTVSRVINQIGICGGILGVFGTFFAFMFVAHRAVSIIIIVLGLIVFILMISLSFTLKISFSVLAYLVCINCIILGFTRLLFTSVNLQYKQTVEKSKETSVDPTSNSSSRITSSKSSNAITPVST